MFLRLSAKHLRKIRHLSKNESATERGEKIVLMTRQYIAGAERAHGLGIALTAIRQGHAENSQIDMPDGRTRRIAGKTAGINIDSPARCFDHKCEQIGRTSWRG